MSFDYHRGNEMSCRKYLCVRCGKHIGQMHRHVSTIHKILNPTAEDIRKFFPDQVNFIR